MSCQERTTQYYAPSCVCMRAACRWARQLDIFHASDLLSNGRVNLSKAEASWGNLSLGVGTLHDVYPYPEIANEMMTKLVQASRLGIPPFFGAEASHGVQMDDHTIFPSPIGLGATWDTELMERYGRVVGSEARSAGLHVTWAPVLGLCREPRWGRRADAAPGAHGFGEARVRCNFQSTRLCP